MEALGEYNEVMVERAARERVLETLADAFQWKIVRDKDGLIDRIEKKGSRSKANAIRGNSMRGNEETGRWYVDLELQRITVEQALAIANVLRETMQTRMLL